jgi:hypothetical protein
MFHHRSAKVLLAILALAGTRTLCANDPPKPTVYLIGVHHAPGQFLTEGLSPGHIRAALQAIDPDIVGVESNPEWFAKGQHYRETYEAYGVAVPWAHERQLRVVGIDWVGDMKGWHEQQRIARVKEEAVLLQSQMVDPARYSYGPSLREQIGRVGDDEIPSFLRLNSAEFAAERIAWLDGSKHMADTPQAYIAVRDAKITEYIAKAAGSRMAVIIGATHVGNVKRELKARGIEVGDLQRLLAEKNAPFDRSADESLTAGDIAAILCVSLDSGIATSHDREIALLRRLEKMAPDQPQDVRDLLAYIEARQAMLEGEASTAKDAFEKLAASDRATAFPYTGYSWRLRLTVQQSAMLELGRLADLAGQRENAIAEYRRLLKTIEAPPYSEDEHSDFELLATASNAVRALTHQPYAHALAFTSTRQQAGAPQPAPADLQPAWDHLRNKRWEELRASLKKVDADSLPFSQQIEHRYMTIILELESGNRDAAAAALQQLEEQCANLPSDHWLKRELPAVQKRLAAAS